MTSKPDMHFQYATHYAEATQSESSGQLDLPGITLEVEDCDMMSSTTISSAALPSALGKLLPLPHLAHAHIKANQQARRAQAFFCCRLAAPILKTWHPKLSWRRPSCRLTLASSGMNAPKRSSKGRTGSMSTSCTTAQRQPMPMADSVLLAGMATSSRTSHSARPSSPRSGLTSTGRRRCTARARSTAT